LVDHDESTFTGASAYLVNLAKFFASMTVFVLVPGNHQEKRYAYDRAQHTDLLLLDYHDDSHVLFWTLKYLSGDVVLLNSSTHAYVDILPFREELGKHVVLHSHEFPEDYIPWTSLSCSPDVVVGDVIANSYEATTMVRPVIQPPIMSMMPMEIAPPRHFEPHTTRLQLASYRLVVLMAGVICHRKNPQLFGELARLLPHVAFLWMGGKAGDADGVLEEANTIHIPHHDRWLELAMVLGADVFLLTSIRDPCPYVMIEALFARLPVITFEASLGHRHPPLDGLHTTIPGEPSAQRVAPYINALVSRAERTKAARETYGRPAASLDVATYLQRFTEPSREYKRLLTGP
jgi:hypothetical protein